MRTIKATVYALLAVAACGGAMAQTDPTKANVDIKPQPFRRALKDLGEQTGLQIMFRVEDVAAESKSAPRVSGKLSPIEALEKLLSKSNLKYQFVNPTTVLISSTKAVAEKTALSMQAGEHERPLILAETSPRERQEAAALQTAESAQETARSGGGMEEVLVTASKREERLIDTPQSVSVLSDIDLNRLGATQFRDFASTVSGLSFTTAGAGYTQVSMRGVTTGQDTSPTVGIYVDDVPFGSSTGFAQGAQMALDVSLLDVDRIEVLRGPQGTLYGASTMGGLVKYVSKMPDFARLSGDMRVGLAASERGSTSYNVAGALNVPVASSAALRASAFEVHDGGYIDAEALGRKNVNRSDIYGGRLDLVLAPSEALTLRLGAFSQNIARDGFTTADYTQAGRPLFGSLDQGNPLAQPFDQRFRLVSATANYNFAPAALTFVSSYQTVRSTVVYDFTRLYAPALAPLASYSVVGDVQQLSTDKFTQEIRLASREERTFEWLVGGFYTHESSSNAQEFVLRDSAGLPVLNDLFAVDSPSKYEESAAFADLTYHFTDAFDMSGGVRYAHNSQTYTQKGSGLLVGSQPSSTSSEDVFTYLTNARYRFNEHATAYARFATGYRPGGPNFVIRDPATGALLAPLTFDADRLKSYELGVKVDSADRALGMELAVYRIKWTDIQVLTTAGGFSVYANAAGASSRGAELSLSARPTRRLSAVANFAYQDAHLTEPAPLVGGVDGERLPNVPHRTASLLADYVIAQDPWRPSIGATIRYVSERTATFDQNALPQYHFPSYAVLDARAGMSVGAVNLQLYVHNVADKRGQLSAYLNSAVPAAPSGPYAGPGAVPVAILQPRTFGLTLNVAF